MTPLALFAVATLSFLTLANLLLTFGVIRRLRSLDLPRHPEALAPELSAGAPAPSVLRETTAQEPAGSQVLVAFMATDCSGCALQLDDLRDFLAQRPRLSKAVFVTTQMHEDSVATSTLEVPDDPRVTSLDEPLGGLWQTGFRVRDFPSFFLVEDGLVVASTHHVGTIR